MGLIQFNEKYRTSIKSIDGQHEQLFNLINDLHDAMKKGKGKEVIGKSLEFLLNYTETHFKDEEKLMISKNYPAYSTHKVQHDKFVVKIKEMADKHKSGSSLVQIEISKFLADWLTEHILKTDMQYVSYLTK